MKHRVIREVQKYSRKVSYQITRGNVKQYFSCEQRQCRSETPSSCSSILLTVFDVQTTSLGTREHPVSFSGAIK
jgi:hypothetical protein